MIEELYEALHRELTKWLGAVTGNRTLAEDLVQEAFLRALLHEDQLRHLSSPQRRAWLYRTAKHLYLDRRRHDSFETIVEEIPEKTAENPEYDRIDSEQLLTALEEEERAMFVLRYLEGYNATEIGRLFDLPPGTVRSKLSDARRRLRRCMDNRKGSP